MYPSSKSCSASSRIICQLSVTFFISGKLSTSMNGLLGTAEKRYMSALYGAMNVEWSVICR